LSLFYGLICPRRLALLAGFTRARLPVCFLNGAHPVFTSHTRLLITAVACSLATLAAAQTEPASLSLAWTRLSPANAPSARSSPAMAFDRAGLKVVLFGGLGDNGYRNDTYTFDGATWT